MSVLLAAVEHTPTVVQAARDGGVVDWGILKMRDINTLITVGIYLVAAAVFLTVAVKAKGSLAGIIIGGATAWMIVWIGGNLGPTDKPAQMIDDEINSAPAIVHRIEPGGTTSGVDG
ncbi:MAG: hypothetical protein ACRDP4_02745 [Nocardioidaceae bacterium]